MTAVGVGVRPDPGRAVVLPQRLRHVRRLPCRDHPARTGWSSPTRKAGRCRRSPRRRASTARSSSTDIEVRTPDGKQLINPLDLRLEVGDTLVVTGPSGVGKTTLLRSLAELWPFTSGTLTRPCGPNETMFLSQMPYVPLGDLRAVVSYPNEEGTIDDETLQAHDGEGGATASGRPARRGAGLGQGALPRRATADRVRPRAADQAQGGVPRRGRRPRSTKAWSSCSTTWCEPSCRTRFWSASATAGRSSSTTHTSSNLLGDGEWRFGRVEGEEKEPALRVATSRGSFPAWKRSRHPRLGRRVARVALWVAKAWAIAAVGTGGPGAARPLHHMGPAVLAHHRRLLQGRQSIPVWALLGVLLASVMIDVRLGVLFSYQSNDQFSALQAAFSGEGAAKESAIDGFWAAILDPRRAGGHRHRPQPARHLPDAAVHHPVARVADTPAHPRLARR